jgi:hypothetical protein
MGARDYVVQRSSQIDQGKTDVLKAIKEVHKVQREVLKLRQIAQVERLLESDTSLANAMEENVKMLAGLETAFGAVVSSIESLPASFDAVDYAEKRLEAALPSTTPPSS